MINKTCTNCNRNFEVENWRKDKAKYCSLDCKNEDFKGKHLSLNTEFKKGCEIGIATRLKKDNKHQGWKGGGRTYHRSIAREVMSEHLNRPLDSDELVHHIDNDYTNNDIENLVLTDQQDHNSTHTSGRVLSQEAKNNISIGRRNN